MPTRPARSDRPRPTDGLSRPTPTANAAALAEWPDGSELDVGVRTERRISGTVSTFGRARFQIRFAPWLVIRLVNARVATPRAAPRRTAGFPVAVRTAAIANHSFEWSAAAVSLGITASSSGLGDSAIAS